MSNTKKESVKYYENTDTKIEVINYFDRNVVVEGKKIKPYSLKQLKVKFPDIDEFSLRLWQKEWIDAREIMLNIEF